MSAELELRGADTRALPRVLREARQRNLDQLRAYRRRKEYPRNLHTPTNYVPCFMDHEGRLCAVAHLMHASGATAAVREIAHTANYARLAQMHHDGLDDWAATSGLTMAELARIQPQYPPDNETLQVLRSQYESVTTTISVIAALGVLSVLTNAVHLTWTYVQRFTVLAGVLLSIALLYLGRSAVGADGRISMVISPFTESLQNYGKVALLIGVISLGVAVWRYWLISGALHPLARVGLLCTLVLGIWGWPRVAQIRAERIRLRNFSNLIEVPDLSDCIHGPVSNDWIRVPELYVSTTYRPKYRSYGTYVAEWHAPKTLIGGQPIAEGTPVTLQLFRDDGTHYMQPSYSLLLTVQGRTFPGRWDTRKRAEIEGSPGSPENTGEVIAFIHLRDPGSYTQQPSLEIRDLTSFERGGGQCAPFALQDYTW